jgi:hypothetical protein
MRANRKQKNNRSMIASFFGKSLTTMMVVGIGGTCLAQSAKKTTSDPYYSALQQNKAQSDASVTTPVAATLKAPSPIRQSFYQSGWEPPKTDALPTRDKAIMKNAGQPTDVWNSFARDTTEPVTRIDFSRLNTSPANKAGFVQTGATVPESMATNVNNAPNKPSLLPLKPSAITARQFQPHTLTPIDSINRKTRSIIRQQESHATPTGNASAGHAMAKAEPIPDAKSIADAKPNVAPKPLTPWRSPSEFNFPKSDASIALVQAIQESDSQTPTAARIATDIENGSSVAASSYQPQLGEKLKQIGSKIKTLASTDRNAQTTGQPQPAVRIADATHNNYSTDGSSTRSQEFSRGSVIIDQGEESYPGESFENSRVLALVGGHPVFVGDMMFEINQILEKYMKGAPQEAKEAQKEKLMARLLQKYVDKKILYVSTLNQLPEGADINDILKQAEKTFNEQALPDMMKRSGVQSPAKFDAILRSQGSSVRQMRRSWAKDQISKFFLHERVSFNRKVTHLEMLDQYRANYDDYAVKGKARWEQIEIQPARAGGRFAAKDKIEDIYQRLVHGGNFEAVAKKESHGFKALNGGQHDWTNKGSLVNKAVDEAIFTLPPGKLSGVIESKTGFHIIRVVERIEDHHSPFTEAQADIKKQLLDQRRDKAFEQYIEQLKDDIKVEYVTQ